jgi:hypothetical protein
MLQRKTGKLPAQPDPRTPELRALMGKVDTPPDTGNWWAPIGAWPMFKNDELGLCVPAGAGHQVQQRTAYTGKELILPDAAIVQTYKEWAGYDGTPATDNGTIMSQAMKLWMTQGIGLPDGSRDKISVFASVNHLSAMWLKRAIWHTGGVLIGFNCPRRWTESVDYLFDIQQGDENDIVGGHCVFLAGYEPTALDLEFDMITWGFRGRVTLRALLALADEAYCILDQNWLNRASVDPAGIDWADAVQSMQGLQQG